jgi:CspA family cold shock protein
MNAGYPIHGPVEGVAVSWHDEDGWGSVSSPLVDGEVFVMFADIRMDGYASLRPGQAVSFTYETPGFLQDGYPHRAIAVDLR